MQPLVQLLHPIPFWSGAESNTHSASKLRIFFFSLFPMLSLFSSPLFANVFENFSTLLFKIPSTFRSDCCKKDFGLFLQKSTRWKQSNRNSVVEFFFGKFRFFHRCQFKSQWNTETFFSSDFWTGIRAVDRIRNDFAFRSSEMFKYGVLNED